MLLYDQLFMLIQPAKIIYWHNSLDDLLMEQTANTADKYNDQMISHIQSKTLQFARDHLILAINSLFTFIYELIGQDLTDNVYINIHIFPLSPLKAMISWNHSGIAYNIILYSKDKRHRICGLAAAAAFCYHIY